MEAKKFRMNELGEFVCAVQTRDSNPVWAENLKQWFDARISELAKNAAMAEIVANDHSEVLAEYAGLDDAVAVYEGQIRGEINGALQNISPFALERFLLAYDSYQDAAGKLGKMRSQGVLNCIKGIKKYRKLMVVKNKSLPLQTLAEIACCLYVSEGLGNDVQAREFFSF